MAVLLSAIGMPMPMITQANMYVKMPEHSAIATIDAPRIAEPAIITGRAPRTLTALPT